MAARRATCRGDRRRPSEQARRRAGIARNWYDKEAVGDSTPTSSVALPVSAPPARRTRSTSIPAAAAPTTGTACSPNTALTYDTYALSNVAGKAMVKRGEYPGSSSADYASAWRWSAMRPTSGESAAGARQRPSPLNRPTSSFLLQAQASKAGGGARQCRRRHHQCAEAGREFGLAQGGQKMIALLQEITDTHALGANQRRPDRHRRLLLGHERRNPRLLETLQRRSATCPP